MKLDEVHLEIMSSCNTVCDYCTWQQRTTDRRSMPKELAFRLIRESASLGVRTMNYHGVGEATLHPDLIDILRLAESIIPEYWLSTNCSMLTGVADDLRKLKKLNLILSVPWTAKKDFVERCLTNAQLYLSQPAQNHRVYIQMVCSEGAQQHYHRLMDELFPYTIRPNIFLYLKQPRTWPNSPPIKGFLRPEMAGHPKVLCETFATPRSMSAECDMPNRYLMVTADGTVIPCCVGMDDWGLGKIGERTLKQVWESAEMVQIRDMWRKADVRIPCGNCKNRKDCI